MTNADEIVKELRKRGLSNGTTLGYHSGLFEAAADLIESLQADAAELKDALKGAKHIADVAGWEMRTLKSQLAASQERERAAVEDLNYMAGCETCKHGNVRAHPGVTSIKCPYFSPNGSCKRYIWRGPQEGEKRG